MPQGIELWVCIYVAKREYESHSWATVSEQQLSRRELREPGGCGGKDDIG